MKIVNVRKSIKEMDSKKRKKLIVSALTGIISAVEILLSGAEVGLKMKDCLDNKKVEIDADKIVYEEYQNFYRSSICYENRKVIRAYEPTFSEMFDSPYEFDWFYNPETGEIEKLTENSLSR